MTDAPPRPVAGNGVRAVPVDLLPGLVAAARRAGLRVARLALDGTRDKATVLALFAAAFDFPGGLGGNWDALADALGDLSWLDAGGHVLVLDGLATLRAGAPEDLDMLLAILDEVALAWAPLGVPFQVFTCDQALPLPAD